MEQRVLARLTRKHFQVGSEEWNGVLFKGQTIRWMKALQSRPCIEVSQELAIEELDEIPVDRNQKKISTALQHCIPGTEAFWDRWIGFAEYDADPVLLQVFRMCFEGSFSNNWWCEVSYQAGKTTPDAASETSIPATHRTVENKGISWCLLQKQWRWVCTERNDSNF